MNSIKLQCRPELLQQWQDDVARNPAAFAAVLTLSPEYLAMLVNDAIAAAWLQARLAAAEERALAAEFVRGSSPTAAVPAVQVTPCRLCHPVTETVAWRCSGQCGQEGGGGR